ncbi:right-handed parallel beta-helix repeat-containing protein [Haloterrigena salifodinae]|uniref:Right-handed parallel beta-helix repeat-containing protein n=1 Tax=Haloterrigena salifodinae TaxID=2675099 RepID=A0A8T8E651_9EURY|nr:right-handed parallel beta-helix repeat-containing protein [Haloterrigena salifodinae]QRV17219.1 right-handed parallel beta-helix repeat-containing protein [Haloterrigena salifodinae]
MKRRWLLAGVGSVSTLCIAGCTGSEDLPNGDGDGTGNSGQSNGDEETTGTAETVVVESGDSIQHAIDEVSPNGTVEVRSGTYVESLAVDKKLVLTAPDGAALDGVDADGGSAITVSESGVQIEGFEIFDYETAGIRTSGDLAEVSITDVELYNISEAALQLTAETVSLADVTLEDNGGAASIEASADGDVTVRNSNFVRSAAGGLTIAGGKTVVLDGVEALQNGGTGINVGGGNVRGQTVEVTDVTSLENGGSGLSVTGTRGDDTVTVETVEAADNSSFGVDIAAESVDVTGLDLRENGTGSGLSIESTSDGDVAVRDSDVTHDGGYGIRVAGGKTVEIEEIGLLQNGNDQLRVEGGDVRGQTVTVRDSSMTENESGNGLSIIGTSGDDTVTVENVDFVDNSYHGIDVAAETVDITGVEVQSGGAADSGISIVSSSDGDVTVRDTTVTDTKRETTTSWFSSSVDEYGYGIHIVNGETIEVENVELRRNEGTQLNIDGNDVRGQTVDVRNSSFIESESGHGVRVLGTRGDDEQTITNCVAEDNSYHGFSLGAETVVIEETSAGGNGDGPLELTTITEEEATIRNSF